MTPVVSAGLDMMGPIEAAFRSAAPARRDAPSASASARSSAATATPAAAKWGELDATHPRGARRNGGRAPTTPGYRFGIENHQDFTSAELVAFCEASRGVGITLRHRQHLPGRRGAARLHPRAIAPHVVHVHLKDYRVQFTDEGYRLVRCAIGDGAVPFARDAAPILGPQHPTLTAVLEPGALEARHVRLFTPDWWNGYAPKTAAELAACLRAARVNRLPEDADYRTPWERGETASWRPTSST